MATLSFISLEIMKKALIVILTLTVFVFVPSCVQDIKPDPNQGHRCGTGEFDIIGAKCNDDYVTDHVTLPCLKHLGVDYLICQ